MNSLRLVGGKGERSIVNLKGLALGDKEVILMLLAAEYIMAASNSRVILCERGIHTFENRNAPLSHCS